MSATTKLSKSKGGSQADTIGNRNLQHGAITKYDCGVVSLKNSFAFSECDRALAVPRPSQYFWIAGR